MSLRLVSLAERREAAGEGRDLQQLGVGAQIERYGLPCRRHGHQTVRRAPSLEVAPIRAVGPAGIFGQGVASVVPGPLGGRSERSGQYSLGERGGRQDRGPPAPSSNCARLRCLAVHDTPFSISGVR